MALMPYALGGAAVGASIFDSIMGNSAADDAKKAAEEATRQQQHGVNYANAIGAPYVQGGTTAYGTMIGGTGLDFTGKTPNLADYWNTPESDLPGVDPQVFANMTPEEQLAHLDKLIASDSRGRERYTAIRKPFAAAVDAWTQSKSGYEQTDKVLGPAPEYQPYEKFSYGGQTPEAPTLQTPTYSGRVPDYSAPAPFAYRDRPEGFRYGPQPTQQPAPAPQGPSMDQASAIRENQISMMMAQQPGLTREQAESRVARPTAEQIQAGNALQGPRQVGSAAAIRENQISMMMAQAPGMTRQQAESRVPMPSQEQLAASQQMLGPREQGSPEATRENQISYLLASNPGMTREQAEGRFGTSGQAVSGPPSQGGAPSPAPQGGSSQYGYGVPDPLQYGRFENESRVPTFGYEGAGPQGFASERLTTPIPSTGAPETFKYRERPPEVLRQEGFRGDSQIPEFGYSGEVPGFSYQGEGPSGFKGDRFSYGDGSGQPRFDYAGQPLSYEAYAGKVPEFVAPTADTVRNDPGYQFRMEQGTRAIEGGAAAKGNLLSGKAQKELAGFGQGLASDEYDRAFGRSLTGWQAGMDTSREGYSRYLDTFDRGRATEQEKYGRAVGEYGLETEREGTAYDRALQAFLTNQGISRDEWATMSAAEQERYRRASSEYDMAAGREREQYGRATGEYGMAAAREGEQYKRGFNEFLTNQGISEANYNRLTTADQEKYRRAFEEYGTGVAAEEKGYQRGQTAYGQTKDQFLVNQGISKQEYDTATAAEKARFDRAFQTYQANAGAEEAQYARDFNAFLANYGISQDNYNRMTAAEKAQYDRAYQQYQTDQAAEGTRYNRATGEYTLNYGVGRDTYATQAGVEAERRRRALEDTDLGNVTRTNQYNIDTSAEANRYGRAANTWGIGYGQSIDENNAKHGRWTDAWNRLAGISGTGQTAGQIAGSNALQASQGAATNTLYAGGVGANAKTNTAQNITGLVGDIAGAYAYGAGRATAPKADDWLTQYQKK